MSLFDSASLVVTPNGTKASKLYAIKPTDGSGDLTVTRATTATRVNSNGLIESVAVNVPRLDYTNSTCPSILVEPQRTNLATYSEQFDNLFWTKVDASINSNVINSPNGTLTADKLVENTANNVHLVFVPPASVAIGTNTLSVYAKADTRDWILMYLFDNVLGSLTAYFNVSNGTLGTIQSGLTANIQNVGNGWYRCSITRTNSNLGNGGFGLASADNVASYIGNGTSGAYFWGAQLEAGAYPTSYIPTVASSVTRNADVISKTGISSLIGQTEGTLYAEYRADNINISARIISVSNGTFANRIVLLNDGGSIRVFVANASVGQVDISFGTWIGSHKIAVAYANNDLVVFLDGVLVATDTSISVPTCSDAQLGTFEDNSNGNPLGGSIKAAALWKTRLSNTELATLTTI